MARAVDGPVRLATGAVRHVLQSEAWTSWTSQHPDDLARWLSDFDADTGFGRLLREVVD